MADRRDNTSLLAPAARGRASADDAPILIGLNAVIFAVDAQTPMVLGVRPPEGHAARRGSAYGLPYGPFDPAAHRTFEIGLRNWVEAQTYLKLGYVEQLYTFGDRGREAPSAVLGDADGAARIISVGYLALAPEAVEIDAPGARWLDWGRFFPWEDWRDGRPPMIEAQILPALKAWATRPKRAAEVAARRARLRACFAIEGARWDEEKVLDRYELLYEARLVAEGGAAKGAALKCEAMISDHRRILATAIGRLRGKLKYRPIVFDLMTESFTLFDLQRTVEAICGFPLHKQNFRRTVMKSGFVAETGEMSTRTGGRPAALYRFRRELAEDRSLAGLQIPRAYALTGEDENPGEAGGAKS